MSYSQMEPSPTGSIPAPQSHTIVLPYGDKYDVVLRVTDDNRVIRIEEIRIKRDFLSAQQKIASSTHIDVEDFYRE